MENAATNQATPTTVNSSVRTREYLTTAEIERLMAAARKSSATAVGTQPRVPSRADIWRTAAKQCVEARETRRCPTPMKARPRVGPYPTYG